MRTRILLSAICICMPAHTGVSRTGASGIVSPSFNCAKARTAGEQMICSEPDLAKADRKMAAAYARLRNTGTPQSFATVRDAQRAWLAYVNHACQALGPMPEDEGAKSDLRGCLLDTYPDRADRLDGLRVYRTGTLVLEPRMRLLTRERPSTEESDIYPYLSGGPPSAAFNAFIASALQLNKRRMDDKNLFPFGDEVADMKLYARRTYSVERSDPKIVSIEVFTYDYSGGAHEALAEYSLNWDMRKRKPISIRNIFADGWKKFAVDFCMKELRRQNAEHPDRDSVEPVVADGRSWLFGKDHAMVHFTVYTVGSFAAGEYDVQIPYRVLKPFLRADAPVP